MEQELRRPKMKENVNGIKWNGITRMKKSVTKKFQWTPYLLEIKEYLI